MIHKSTAWRIGKGNQRSSSIILVVCLAIPTIAESQLRHETNSLSDTLAQVGGEAILARDLVDRINLMPWPGKGNPDELDSLRIRALQSLVAERILAIEAASRGLGNDSSLRRQVNNVEKMLVRDQLYRQEVVPKVRVNNNEILEGVQRFAWNIKGLMLGAGSKREALKLASSLSESTTRDSVLHALTESHITIDTINVQFGLLERSQEDVVYSLTEGRPVSQPVNVPGMGWAVLCYLQKETNPEYAKRSRDEQRNAVRETIRRRKEAVEAGRYSAKVLSPQKAEANADTFDLFARTIYDILISDSAAYGNDSGYRLDFIVDAAEARLRQYLTSTLVGTSGGGIAIGDVLEGYRAFQYLLPNLNKREVWQRLNATVKDAAAREYLAREGYTKHLNRNEDVRHDVEMWTNYWLSELMENHILKDVKVEDDEVLTYLVTHASDPGRSYEVNVREILSDSLSESVSNLEKITRGEEMATLARMFSKRQAWAIHGGESGFFPVSEHPEIGFRALDSEIGTTVGPVKVPEGFSLFTVLAKRSTGNSRMPSYDSLKAQIKRGLYLEKQLFQLNRYIASAAPKYQVKLFYNHLKDVEISPTNMVTKRFIGFGGTMMAVPGLYPLWDWVRNAPDVKEVLP